MKKVITSIFTLIIVILLTIFSLSSCSKEDEADYYFYVTKTVTYQSTNQFMSENIVITQKIKLNGMDCGWYNYVDGKQELNSARGGITPSISQSYHYFSPSADINVMPTHNYSDMYPIYYDDKNWKTSYTCQLTNNRARVTGIIEDAIRNRENVCKLATKLPGFICYSIIYTVEVTPR